MREKTKVAFGAHGVDKRNGREGVTAFALIGEKYPKRYQIKTHGMTPAQVAAKVREMEARQVVKEAKLDEIQNAVGGGFIVGGTRYLITDAIISERGTDTQVVIQIAREIDGGWQRLEGMPIRRVVGPVDLVPDAAGIEAIALEFIESFVAKRVAAEEFAAEVTRLLEEPEP